MAFKDIIIRIKRIVNPPKVAPVSHPVKARPKQPRWKHTPVPPIITKPVPGVPPGEIPTRPGFKQLPPEFEPAGKQFPGNHQDPNHQYFLLNGEDILLHG